MECGPRDQRHPETSAGGAAMSEQDSTAEILTDDTFQVPSGRPGTRRALLINPPVYDAQYWARWSQPAGLLRIATLLKQRGYAIDFVDCMETDAHGFVKKAMRHDAQGKPLIIKRDDIVKRLYH